VLHPDDIEGWHGEIRDKKVVKDDETARREEQDNVEDEGGEVEANDEELEEEELEDQAPEREEPHDEEQEPEPHRRRSAARGSTTPRIRQQDKLGERA
jgi:hypothetical protein